MNTSNVLIKSNVYPINSNKEYIDDKLFLSKINDSERVKKIYDTYLATSYKDWMNAVQEKIIGFGIKCAYNKNVICHGISDVNNIKKVICSCMNNNCKKIGECNPNFTNKNKKYFDSLEDSKFGKNINSEKTKMYEINSPIDNINIDNISKYEQEDFEVIYDDDDNYVSIQKYKSINEDVVLPSQYRGLRVKGIYNEAFMNSKIVKIRVPIGIITVGENAFRNCTSLETVIIDGLEEIENFAFYGCNNISKIAFPNHAIKFGKGVFDACSEYCKTEFRKYLRKFNIVPTGEDKEKEVKPATGSMQKSGNYCIRINHDFNEK